MQTKTLRQIISNSALPTQARNIARKVLRARRKAARQNVRNGR